MRICVGIDAAKVTHWAVAVDAEGRVVLDRAVENDPDAIDSLVAELRGLGGEAMIGLDVVGSFARFLEAVLLAEGFALVHTPGIAVNRAGQGFSGGERKSDPRDARTIADLVRTRDLRPILPDDDTLVALRLKVGRRRELIQGPDTADNASARASPRHPSRPRTDAGPYLQGTAGAAFALCHAGRDQARREDPAAGASDEDAASARHRRPD